MAEPPYTVSVDRERSLVRLTLSGLWDLPTCERYAADVRKAFAGLVAMGVPIDAYGVLIDLRRHGVQSREVSERTQAELRNGISSGSHHAVLVSESVLHKMQAQRVGSLIGASFFTDEARAIDWLLARE